MTPMIFATILLVLGGLCFWFGYEIGKHGRTKNEEINELLRQKDELEAQVGAMREMLRTATLTMKLEDMIAQKKQEATRKAEPLGKQA